MRRWFIVIILFALIICTCCDPAIYHMSEADCKNITQIQLIYYENPDAAKLDRLSERVIPFKFEKMQIVEIMSKEKREEFLTILPQLDYWPYEGRYDSPNGYSLKLDYDNGNFMILSFNEVECDYAALFDKNGNILSFLGLFIIGTSEVNQYLNFEIPIKHL